MDTKVHYQSKGIFEHIYKYMLDQLFTRNIDVQDEARKGKIFIYFIGATGAFLGLVMVTNIYSAIVLDGAIAQERANYALSNFIIFIILLFIWLAHKRYPRPTRHVFLCFLVIGTIFFLQFEQLTQLFIILTLPIIMAAFLIQPLFSIVYYLLIIIVYLIRLLIADSTIIGNDLIYLSFGFLIALAIVAWLISGSLEQALKETKILNRELDQRVQNRTSQLADALEREQTAAVRNETILNSIADGILVFDAYQNVLMANPAINKMAKRDISSLRQTDLFNSINPNSKNTLQSWLNGQPQGDSSHLRFDWHDQTVSASVAPVLLPKEGGQQVDAGKVMVLRDFTREAELEQAKNLFFGMVSHELRTPMSSIQGYIDLLIDIEKDNISEEGHGYLETVAANIRQLLTLANELIDLTRMDTGEIELYCDWHNIPSIVDQAVKTVQQEYTKRNLTLDVKTDQGLIECYVDQRRILQVMLNLLSNAYKYTTKGGATISVSQTEQCVEISVTDTGTGLKLEDQDRMFERFFRANDPVVQMAGGTGLGMNISKGLTELHGGTLTFESEYGKGTTFFVRIPKTKKSPDHIEERVLSLGD